MFKFTLKVFATLIVILFMTIFYFFAFIFVGNKLNDDMVDNVIVFVDFWNIDKKELATKLKDKIKGYS